MVSLEMLVNSGCHQSIYKLKSINQVSLALYFGARVLCVLLSS